MERCRKETNGIESLRNCAPPPPPSTTMSSSCGMVEPEGWALEKKLSSSLFFRKSTQTTAHLYAYPSRKSASAIRSRSAQISSILEVSVATVPSRIIPDWRAPSKNSVNFSSSWDAFEPEENLNKIYLWILKRVKSLSSFSSKKKKFFSEWMWDFKKDNEKWVNPFFFSFCGVDARL